MSDLSVIYYTDNSLPHDFEARCQRELSKAAAGQRIIAVSQHPLDWVGVDNVILQGIGRNLRSLFVQPLTGAKIATTRYIAMAEHDCFYTPEHFAWRPPDDGIFWYNVAHWFVNFQSGIYTYYRRKPMSMLICEREIFIRAVEEKIEMLETGFKLPSGGYGVCEPGVIDGRADFALAKSEWWHSMKDVGKEPKWTAKAFRTELQNLDIRHGGNYSGNAYGPKIAKSRHHAEELPYWGRFHDYWGAG